MIRRRHAPRNVRPPAGREGGGRSLLEMVKGTSALAGSNKSRATRRLLSASNCFNGTAISGPHHTGCKTPRLDTVRPIDAQAGLIDVAPFVLAVAVGMFRRLVDDVHCAAPAISNLVRISRSATATCFCEIPSFERGDAIHGYRTCRSVRSRSNLCSCAGVNTAPCTTCVRPSRRPTGAARPWTGWQVSSFGALMSFFNGG